MSQFLCFFTLQLLYQSLVNKPYDFEAFSFPAGCLLFEMFLELSYIKFPWTNQVMVNCVLFWILIGYLNYIKFLITNYIILNRFRVRQGPLHESVFVFVKVTSFISNSLLANHMSLNSFRPLQGVCFLIFLFNWFISNSY